ncbi:MAG: hypothetical protein A4E46_01367 [Methanosaeta sp. PtaU1.Bin016]|nr:MAG: hypothetical protein A4E46_01367 [Methanosaeta sp. PtaU1.Bin016]
MMNIIKEELSRFDCFRIQNVVYKEEQKGDAKVREEP